MRPTRRLLAVGLLAVVLAICAIVFARPPLLFGTALVGSWILARQYHFLRLLSGTMEGLTIEQSPASSVVRTEERTPVRLSAHATNPVPIAIVVKDGIPPAGQRDDPLNLALDPGETQGTQRTSVTWPIAGHHQFTPATLVATDGWFRETVPIETTPAITVEPRGPTTIHIGAGGNQLSTAYGEHRSRLPVSGTEVDTVREYQPGDPVRRIDWNATARLASLHVRQFDAQTNRPTLLVMDLRASLWTGQPAETKLDYLREAALTVAASAQQSNDPLGIATLDDHGLCTRIDPEASARAYRQVRTQLFELGTIRSPDGHRSTQATRTGSSATRTGSSAPRTEAVSDGGIPVTARSNVLSTPALADDPETEPATSFVEMLRPFFEARSELEIAADSFVGGLDSLLRVQNREHWTVLCTDDSSPRTLWKAVTMLRERGHHVLVLLAPTVLFEDTGFTDLDAAYERYVAFEKLRRDLDRAKGVRALEIAPDERLETVLSAETDRQRSGRR